MYVFSDHQVWKFFSSVGFLDVVTVFFSVSQSVNIVSYLLLISALGRIVTNINFCYLFPHQASFDRCSAAILGVFFYRVYGYSGPAFSVVH